MKKILILSLSLLIPLIVHPEEIRRAITVSVQTYPDGKMVAETLTITTPDEQFIIYKMKLYEDFVFTSKNTRGFPRAVSAFNAKRFLDRAQTGTIAKADILIEACTSDLSLEERDTVKRALKTLEEIYKKEDNTLRINNILDLIKTFFTPAHEESMS